MPLYLSHYNHVIRNWYLSRSFILNVISHFSTYSEVQLTFEAYKYAALYRYSPLGKWYWTCPDTNMALFRPDTTIIDSIWVWILVSVDYDSIIPVSYNQL